MLGANFWLAAAGFSALPVVVTELDEDKLGLPDNRAKQPVTRNQSSVDGAYPD